MGWGRMDGGMCREVEWGRAAGGSNAGVASACCTRTRVWCMQGASLAALGAQLSACGSCNACCC